jgi:hypothetical protein
LASTKLDEKETTMQGRRELRIIRATNHVVTAIQDEWDNRIRDIENPSWGQLNAIAIAYLSKMNLASERGARLRAQWARRVAAD